MKRKNHRMHPVHPGEILNEDLLEPLGISLLELARALKLSRVRLSQIVKGRRGIDTDVALRLARYFGSTPEFWMNLQTTYDLRMALEKSAKEIERDVRPRKAA